MENINKLESDEIVLCLLSLSNLILENISDSKGFNLLEESVNACWRWLQSKEVSAEDLHLYLENFDEMDVLSYMYHEKDSYKNKCWNCIANALAYTIYAAYNFEGTEYLPETVKNVDEETIAEFIENFKKVYQGHISLSDLIDYLLETKGLKIPERIKRVKAFMEQRYT